LDYVRLERLLDSLHGLDMPGSVLERICTVAAAALALDGAGLSSLSSHGREMLVATDPTATVVETLQIEFEQGPCAEVVDSQVPYLEPELTSAAARDRWPAFTRLALDEGISSVHAFPLIVDGRSVGALDVYARRPGTLDTDQLADGVMLAGLAALAIKDGKQGSGIAGVDLVIEPSEPWAHPAVVHNASGILSEQLGISIDEAFVRLRVHAFGVGRSVNEVAADVVARRLRLQR